MSYIDVDRKGGDDGVPSKVPVATKLKCCMKIRSDMPKLTLDILLAVCLHEQTNLCEQNQTVLLARMLECRMLLLVSCVSFNSVFNSSAL